MLTLPLVFFCDQNSIVFMSVKRPGIPFVTYFSEVDHFRFPLDFGPRVIFQFRKINRSQLLIDKN